MATKGESNRYGNSRGGKKGKPTKHINYEYAKAFFPRYANEHYTKHGNDFKADGPKEYMNRAVKFANQVDKKNCKSVVDYNGTTYKYNTKTKELVIVTKKGLIVSYYKISPKQNGFSYIDRRGKKIWKKV